MIAEKKNIQLEAMPGHQPTQHPDSPQVVRRRVENKPRRSFYTLKMLLATCGIGVFALMFVQLYIDTQINHVHYEIQRTRLSINRETIMNEQLNAQISELSQHSRIMEIATSHGLTFNENNIINIER